VENALKKDEQITFKIPLKNTEMGDKKSSEAMSNKLLMTDSSFDRYDYQTVRGVPDA
jgi:hypothetical protein